GIDQVTNRAASQNLPQNQVPQQLAKTPSQAHHEIDCQTLASLHPSTYKLKNGCYHQVHFAHKLYYRKQCACIPSWRSLPMAQRARCGISGVEEGISGACGGAETGKGKENGGA